jgi:Uncharacterised nucleotidyltransferase
MELSDGEQTLCRLLTGGSEQMTPEVLVAARRHRLHYLLAHIGLPADTAPGLRAELGRELRQAAALDAIEEEDLRGLLAALAADGVKVLVLKGAALAQMVYPAPHVRPRVDTDLLISRERLGAAERVFMAQGWSHPAERVPELSAAQRHYVKPGPASAPRHLDVHWRIANARLFGDALSFDELWTRAVPVPAFGAAARAAGLTDALLVACLHRVAHHDDEVDLLWLWDIHLLAQRLSAQEQIELAATACRAGLTGVCAHGLDLVSAAFATPAAAPLAARLRAAGNGRTEPASRFIGGARRITMLRTDLAALAGWRARLRLIAEHVFPSRQYMRTLYPGWPDGLLWLTYADRVARGAPGWFRRPRQSRR